MSHNSTVAKSTAAPKKRRVWIRAAIVLVLVAPLLVAAAWMWSMWDPSHYLSDAKLAVVNEDTGTEQNGKHVSFGDDVVDGLLNTDYLNFTKLSAQEAEEGMRDGEYMAVLSIAKEFSKDVASVIDPKPRQAKVVISYNDHYGTNTPLLTCGLIPGIQQGIQQGISEGYGAQILDGMNQLGNGLKEAADGSVQLDDGMAQLKDGTEQIRTGAAQLDDGMGQLLDGTHQLGDGAAQIDDGVGQLTGMLIPMLRQAGGVYDAIAPVLNTLDQAGMHAQAQQIRDQISMLNNNDPQALANQLQKLKDGTAEMRYNLTDPGAPYMSGVLQLKDGTKQLRDGTYQLDDGARQLKDGTAQLRTGLVEGSKQAPTIKDINSSSHQIAVPVSYSQNYENPVQTLTDLTNPTSKVLSGGVTMILILVFGYLFMALVSMLAPHILGRRQLKGAVVPVLAGFGLVGLINLIILGLLTWAGSAADFSIESPKAYTLVLILIAANGTAAYQMLRLAFGRLVGGTLALGYFAYGVFCFGGVWPTQLTPVPLRALHYLHPMSYARDAYVRAVDSNFDGTYYRAIVVLILTTVCFLGISMIVRSIQLRKRAESSTTETMDNSLGEVDARI